MADQQAPPNFPFAKLAEARKPNSGGELQVFISPAQALEVATFTCTAANSGTLSIDAGYAAALSAEPRDLVAVVAGATLQPTADVVLNVTGIDSDSAGHAGAATIANPNWVGSTVRVFPIGYGVDVIPAATYKLWKVLGAIIPTNLPVGAKVKIFSMPLLSSYERVGCTSSISFNTKEAGNRAVACGLDGSAFTKRARSEPGELSIDAKDFTILDGLAKYRGAPVTVLVKVVKDETTTTEHLFFTGVRYKAKTTHGDGDDDSTQAASGMFEAFIGMMAKAAE